MEIKTPTHRNQKPTFQKRGIPCKISAEAVTTKTPSLKNRTHIPTQQTNTQWNTRIKNLTWSSNPGQKNQKTNSP